MAKIIVKDESIKTINKDGVDYICITNITKLKKSRRQVWRNLCHFRYCI